MEINEEWTICTRPWSVSIYRLNQIVLRDYYTRSFRVIVLIYLLLLDLIQPESGRMFVGFDISVY